MKLHTSHPESRWLTFEIFEDIPALSHASYLRPTPQTRTGFWAKQCHGTHIIDVTQQSAVGQFGDALVTREVGLALTISHADCQVALIYDPMQRVIAAVHSGWRGSVQNIYGKVIQHLRNAYACKPENLLIGIGPSLGPTHAEFIHFRTELPEPFWQYQVRPHHFDFWAISDGQLRDAGILPQHIEMAKICTYANPSDFYSYRRDKTSERHSTFIQMRNA